jgi:hypothetical protein
MWRAWQASRTWLVACWRWSPARAMCEARPRPPRASLASGRRVRGRNYPPCRAARGLRRGTSSYSSTASWDHQATGSGQPGPTPWRDDQFGLAASAAPSSRPGGGTRCVPPPRSGWRSPRSARLGTTCRRAVLLVVPRDRHGSTAPTAGLRGTAGRGWSLRRRGLPRPGTPGRGDRRRRARHATVGDRQAAAPRGAGPFTRVPHRRIAGPAGYWSWLGVALARVRLS